MAIALGSDHAGFALKKMIGEHLEAKGIDFADFGTFCESSVDYPDIALPLIAAVAAGDYQLGILVCGTGIGMTIAANKYPGIRAAPLRRHLFRPLCPRAQRCQHLNPGGAGNRSRAGAGDCGCFLEELL